MRKYTVAHSFLMITSVFAATPYPVRRQGTGIIGQPATTAQSSSAQSAPTSTSQPVSTNPVTTTVVTSTPPSTTSTPASTPTSSTATPTSTASTTSLVSSSSPSALSSPSITSDSSSAVTSTDAQGSPTTVFVAATDSTTSSSPSSSTGPSDTNSSTPISSGTIIGLSVAGGIAALAIIGFIIWKLTRKRFSDLDDPDEAIKWPELSRESDTGGMNDGLSRQLSDAYPSTVPSRNASTLDQSDPQDPYAVPPLPQFNPNQPYRDDPYAASNAGFYDPYRGPIPQTFHDGSIDGHENIPMSTYPLGSRSRSPGPGIAYDMGGRGSPTPGRASPALGQGYDMGGRGSPAPGRTISPGPAAALGLDRRPSPGAQSALNGPPEMASRTRGPGPNVLG